MYDVGSRARSEMRDCVLSGRFNKKENTEFRELAAAMSLPVTLLVRTALMEWKSRQEAKTCVTTPNEEGRHAVIPADVGENADL